MSRAAAAATLRAAALLVAATTAALATADGPDFYRVRDIPPEALLGIWAEPDTEALLLGTVPHDGDGIRNLGCEGRMGYAEWEAASEAERAAAADRVWCRVEHGGVTGWARGRNLGEGSAP